MADARNYFVTCAEGLEAVVAGELHALGARDIHPARRGVACTGDRELRYRANLWCRAATRVLERLLRTEATTMDALYTVVRGLDWPALVTPEQTLAVEAHVGQGRLGARHFVAQRVKDAVCDRCREATGARPSVDRADPDLPLVLHVHGPQVTLWRDTSGASLHKRGYREALVRSPLNEALAAGILLLAKWDGTTPLADPMCGSGTFPIEAALLAARRAPGLLRDFAFERWPDHGTTVWASAREAARAEARPTIDVPIFASDHHAGALGLARRAARAAGVEDMIRFAEADVATFAPDPPPQTIVVNPPYGERLDGETDLPALYRSLGTSLRRFPGATAWILSGNPDLERHIGMRPTKAIALRNGALPCQLLKYEVFG